MPAPSTTEEFLDLVRKSGVVDDKRLGAYLDKVRAASALPEDPKKLAGFLVRDGVLTHFQAEQVLQGKWRRFTIGKYKVLERLGSGGMGSVYLCEHKLMRRRVAVKILPTAKAEDPSSLERFYREARAVAALDHPNIVRAYDIDQDEKLHFLVMEYVDGASLQEIIKKVGPMDVVRVAHYLHQSAMGLQHAHETAGLVHRDVKPGNILIDRTGCIKILDMGLARFFHDEEDILTKKYDENVLGTADYLAPEQALDSHGVDIRADIYSLGATFYFCLTGRTPFTEGTVAQKLIWHQTRQPKPIRQVRPEVPEGLVAILEKMMAKDPAHRYQTPTEVAEAIAPWTQTPIGPPPDEEMPQLSPAALGLTIADGSASFTAPSFSGQPGSSPRKNWQVASGGGSRPPSSGAEPTHPSAQAEQPTAPTSPSRVPPRPSTPAPRSASAPALAPSTYRTANVPRTTAAVAPGPAPSSAQTDRGPQSWDKVAARITGEKAATSAPPTPQPNSPSVVTRRLGGTTSIGLPDRQRVWIVVGVVAAIVVGLAALAAWWALTRQPPTTASARPPAARTFKVGKDATHKTVADVLKLVRPGDRITLTGPEHAENLVIDGTDERLKNITLEGEEGDTPVVWKPRTRDPNQMIVLLNISGWLLRRLTFDGQDACRSSVIVLSGHCPGTTFENIRIEGFKTVGLVLANCEGQPGRPLVLTDSVVRATDRATATAALRFSVDPKMQTVKANQHLSLRNCRLEGAYQALIELPDRNTTHHVEMKDVTGPKGEVVALPRN